MNKPGQQCFRGVDKVTVTATPNQTITAPQPSPIKFVPGLTPVVYANAVHTGFGQGEVTLTFGQNPLGPQDESVASVRLIIPHHMLPQLMLQLDFVNLTLNELYGAPIPTFKVAGPEEMQSAVIRVQEKMNERLKLAAEGASRQEQADMPDMPPAPSVETKQQL